MKRVYRYRSSDNVIVGFFEATDSYALQPTEFESKSVSKDIFDDRVGKFVYDPANGAVSNRTQADIDAEAAALVKARVRETLEFRSPDGTVWKLKVDNTGSVSASKA